MCACIFVAISSSARAAIIASSTFDSGAEGWSVVDLPTPNISNPPPVLGTYPVTFFSSGGNPGGYISMTDPSGNWFMFSAPNTYLGDQSSAFGGTLSYDIRVTPVTPGEFTAVVLVGLEHTLFFDTPSPSNEWSTYNILLGTAGWKLDDQYTGPEPTSLEMEGVLSDLQALYISGDWLDGVETADLDNVSIVPIPGTVLLLSSGLASIAAFRRRRNG
jgi:hypothetical protein